MKYIIAALLAAITTVAVAQTTMTTIGNTTYINSPRGSASCTSIGNTVYCN